MCIVFLPNPPIAILEIPKCLSHEWLIFLKRYWLVTQKHDKAGRTRPNFSGPILIGSHADVISKQFDIDRFQSAD